MSKSSGSEPIPPKRSVEDLLAQIDCTMVRIADALDKNLPRAVEALEEIANELGRGLDIRT